MKRFWYLFLINFSILFVTFLFLSSETLSAVNAQINRNTQQTVLLPVLSLLLGEKTVSDVIKDVDLNNYATDCEVVTDQYGRQIVLTKMMIVFKPKATPSEFDQLLENLNATIVSSVARTRSVVVRIPQPENLVAYYALIDQIEAEPFVDFVWKGEVPQLASLPSGYQKEPPDLNELPHIDNHLAIRAHAAWNASSAIDPSYKPQVVVADSFGDVPTNDIVHFQLVNSNFRIGVSETENGHGFAVLGILAGTHDNFYTSGMYPGTSTNQIRLGVVDFPSSSGSSTNRLVFAEIMNKLLTLLTRTPGKIVLNTSIGYACDGTGGNCIDIDEAREIASLWVEYSRMFGLEGRVFHATSAGNIKEIPGSPGLIIRDASTNSPFSSAALLSGLSNGLGQPLSNLTNTAVVENAVNRSIFESPDVQPIITKCLYKNSFIGGFLSGIGTNVRSFITYDSLEFDEWTGTSYATPQVAGLATYIWNIDHSLSPQQIKNILFSTSNSIPVISDPECSDWQSPAPIVDAYDALLALDADDSHPVRTAILDINGDNSFNENDLQEFYNKFYDTSGGDPVLLEPDVPDYGRKDLNGDGWTGGSKTTKFDLNMNRTIDGKITQSIGGNNVEFYEDEASDMNVLCYYAYSDLYTGNTEQRDNLIGSICGKEECLYDYSYYDINYGYFKTCRQPFNPKGRIMLVHTIDQFGFDQIILEQEVCNEPIIFLFEECLSNSRTIMNWGNSYPGPAPSIWLNIEKPVYITYRCLPVEFSNEYDLMVYDQGSERLGTYSTLKDCETELRTYIPQDPSLFVYPGTCHDWWDHAGQTCTY